MTTSAYHRDVLALLRDDYGVTDAYVGHGGNHPQITFTYDGAPRHVTLNNKAFSPRAFDLKRRDIRRLLGDPPPRAARERRTMEEMMPEPVRFVPHPPVQNHEPSMGQMALYKDSGKTGLRLRFYLPPAAIASFPAAVETTRVSPDSWQLTPCPSIGPRLRKDGVKYLLDAGTGAALIEGFAAPFGVTPAEYLAVDGTVLVRLLTDQIRPVQPTKAGRFREIKGVPSDGARQKVQDLLTAFTPMAEDKTPPAAPDAAPAVDDLRACLAALRRIEATTPYRLLRVKETGGWCFSAPRIE